MTRVPVRFQRLSSTGLLVLSIGDAREQVRVTDGADDRLLERLILTGQDWVEQYTGRALATSTWRASMPVQPCRVWLPRAAPLQAVTAVSYYDAAGVSQVLDPSRYLVIADDEPASIVAADVWPTMTARPDALTVTYTAGYAQASGVPPSLVHAVALLVGHWYAHGEAAATSGAVSKEIEFAARDLCRPYRVHRLEMVA